MSITVGDAVLYFTGDTTDLDQAFERVNSSARAKLEPVSKTIRDIGGEWQFTGRATSTAGSLAESAGQQMENAAFRGSRSFHETRNSIDLLANQIGIALPRELKGFLAELGPVQGLLSGAFQGVAIGALAAVLVEATQKLTEWVSETFVYTDAMKAVDAVTADVNKRIADQVAQLGKLKEAYALAGLQGSALTLGEFAQLSVTFKAATSDMARFQDQIFGLRRGLLTIPEGIAIVNAQIKNLNKDLPKAELEKKLLPDDATFDQVIGALSNFAGDAKAIADTLGQQLAGIQKNYDAQALQEQLAIQEAKIAAVRQGGEAQANLELQLTLLRNAQLKAAYGADEAAQVEYINRKFQNDLSAFQAQRTLADQRLENDRKNLEIQKSLISAKDPDAVLKAAVIDQEIQAIERQHAAAIIAIDEQIVVARKQHATQIVADYRQAFSTLEAENKKFADAQRADVGKLLDSVTQDIPIADTFNPWVKGIESIQAAYQTLGISGVLPLTGQLREERLALDQLFEGYTQGLVSKEDYINASLREIDTEIALARAIGASTRELERQREGLRRQSAEQRSFERTTVSVANAVAGAVLQEGFAFGQGAITIGQALRSITAVMIQEIAKQAAARGAAKFAEALGEVFHAPAAAALDFASAAAWFALAGGISAAAGAVAGSGREGNGPQAPSNLPPVQQTPATTAQQNPSQIINIPRFAVGGLVSQKTLAILGDSPSGGNARELVMPVDDDRVMDLYADRIATRIGAGGGTVIENHFHVRGLISSDNLRKVTRKVTREVNKGTMRLTASRAREK